MGPSRLDPRAFAGWFLIGAIVERYNYRETWTIDDLVGMMYSLCVAMRVAIRGSQESHSHNE